MSITLLDFDVNSLEISMREALRYMGVTGDAPDVLSEAEWLLIELQNAASPKACFGEYPVSSDGDLISIGGITTGSASLRKNLAECTSAVIFAATIGIGTDRLIAKYSKLAPSKAVILSALGSAMIESLCDEMCHRFAEEYKKIGKCIKPRFSPGYGGFSLSAQANIAHLLETEKRIGLYFTDSLMMIPEKSVTAIVGIFDKVQTEE